MLSTKILPCPQSMICLYWEDTGVLDNTETAPALVTLGPLPLFYLLLAILLTIWHYFIVYLFAVCLRDHEFLKASVGSLVLIALSQVLGH